MPQPSVRATTTPGDIADMIGELTREHVHRERYQVQRGGTWCGTHHQVVAPSLIQQLTNVSPARGGAAEHRSAGYGSRPLARIESLDCLARIDREAAQWVRWLGEDDPGDTTAVVLRLHGLMAGLDAQLRAMVVRDVWRWWAQARVVSGWDCAPWRPDNTCPLCAHRGGLRIKLADHMAFCGECGETWTGDTIGLVADHIRDENADQAVA